MSGQASPLASLRAVVAPRPHSPDEARQAVAEQARALRLILQSDTDRGPWRLSERAVTSIGRLRVMLVDEPDFAVSALAQWHRGAWYIALDAREPATRRRYSLAYEVFHVVNHPTWTWLLPERDRRNCEQQYQELAHHFAACLLMPEGDVRRLCRQGAPPAAMARSFGVSIATMRKRIEELGMAPDDSLRSEAA